MYGRTILATPGLKTRASIQASESCCPQRFERVTQALGIERRVRHDLAVADRGDTELSVVAGDRVAERQVVENLS